MRVLVVTQYFWPESFRINELINALHATGCEITVLTGQPNYPDGKIFKGYHCFSFQKESYNGYTILRVPLVPRGRSGAFRLFTNYLFFMLSAVIFGPIRLRGKKFDAVFAVNQSPVLAVIPAIIIKKIKRIPLITWIGDLWPQSLESTGHIKNKLVLSVVEKIVRWIYRNNNLLLLQSATFEVPVKALCRNVPVAYLPNPAEQVYSTALPAGTPALLLKNGFNIVYAGNIGTVQSLEMIVAVATLLKQEKEIRFVLVGSGSKSDWLQQQVVENELANIDLPGRFAPEAIPAILAQADALLVSLVKDPTMSLTVPAKTQTYMAAGKPIIAALDGEGARVVTAAGAGVAVPAEDAKALTNAILYLYKLPAEERKAMGAAGRKYYQENYDSAVLAQKLTGFMEETIVRFGNKIL